MVYLDKMQEFNTEYGFLHLVVGPMFSGKTTKLLETVKQLIEQGMDPETDIIVVNHNSDNRYDDKEYIVSHNNQKFKCYKLQTLSQLFDIFKYFDARYILIDEAQFFPDISENLLKMVTYHQKHVVVAGLSSGSNMQGFDQIQKLYPNADIIEHLVAKCVFCDKNAPFQRRFHDVEQGEIFVGSTQQYYATCREHFITKARLTKKDAPINKHVNETTE